MNSKRKPDWYLLSNRLGKEMLRPLTTEETRKNGKQLVIVSFLTVLFCVNIIRLKDNQFNDYTVISSSFPFVILIAGITTVYFLVNYYLMIIGDIKKWKYDNEELDKQFSKILKEVNILRNKHPELYLALAAKQMDNETLKKKKWEELGLNKEVRPYLTLREEREMTFEETEGINDEIEKQLAEREPQENQYYVYAEKLDEDLRRESERLYDLSKEKQDNLQPLLKTFNDISRLYRQRLRWEKYFPCSFAVGAIILIVLRIAWPSLIIGH